MCICVHMGCLTCVCFVFDSHHVCSFTLSPHPASIPPRAVIKIQASSCRRGAAGEAAGSGEGGCVQHRGSKEVERSDITAYIFALESIYYGSRVQLLACVVSHLALICVCTCISSDHYWSYLTPPFNVFINPDISTCKDYFFFLTCER